MKISLCKSRSFIINVFGIAILSVLTGCATVSDALYTVGTVAQKVAPDNEFIKNSGRALTLSADLVYSETGPLQESMIGYEVSAKLIDSYDVLPQDSSLSQYVATVGKTLSLVSDSPYTYRSYTFAVLNAPDEINAFAAPGGYIFVTTGMLNFLRNEDELAVILGHEIGHVEKGHAMQAAGRENVIKLLALITNYVKEQQKMDPKLQKKFDALYELVVNKIVTAVHNGYSVDMEAEADRRSIEFAYKLGYDATALSGILERFKKEKGNYGGGAYPAERKEDAEKHAQLISKGNFFSVIPERTRRFESEKLIIADLKR